MGQLVGTISYLTILWLYIHSLNLPIFQVFKYLKNPTAISDDDLFTGMFSGHYNNPSGFCFDIACTDEPINDNPKLQGYNVDEKVKPY